jgi:membrane fusion protein (multidrug efflux system)
LSARKQWACKQSQGETNVDLSNFGNRGWRPADCSDYVHTTIAQEQRTYPTWRRQEASPVIFRKQKEKTVSYAFGLLYGHVLRLRPDANLAAVAALCILVSGCNRGQATIARPVPEVAVATGETRDVPMYSEWVATLDGYVNAEIRPQVSGYIIKQNYKEGSLVHEGQVLFEIDPRPFQATLDRAKGDLAQAQAQLGKATLDVERDTPLAEGRAIAKSQLDNEVQAKLGAQASVESAKAAVEQAQLNLEWTKVTSLVDGIAGIAQVQIGNLVGPTSMLTSVSQVDPIKAFFPINEHEYLLAQKKTNAIPGKHTINFFGTSVRLILSDGSVYPQTGKILLADRQVDANTGTIRIVAAFPNPGNVLRPGQYGRVRVETELKSGALLLPQSAVAQSQGSYQVAVVGSDHKVSMRTVKPGATVGTMWVIDEGLKPGEQVVVQGLQQLREGTLVAPKPVHLSGEGN